MNMTEDVIQMVALRAWLEELSRIRKSAEVHQHLVDEARKRAVRAFTDSLYRRYKAWIKKSGEEVTFDEWLVQRAELENTYQHSTIEIGNAGFSLVVRRRWAIWQTEQLFKSELTPHMYDQPGEWAVIQIEQILNAKSPPSEGRIAIMYDFFDTDDVKKRPYLEGRSLRFVVQEYDPTDPYFSYIPPGDRMSN